jgi:hypothetical protein
MMIVEGGKVEMKTVSSIHSDVFEMNEGNNWLEIENEKVDVVMDNSSFSRMKFAGGSLVGTIVKEVQESGLEREKGREKGRRERSKKENVNTIGSVMVEGVNWMMESE